TARHAVGADRLGKAPLYGAVAPPQFVIRGIGNLGRVLSVIELVVMQDLGGEPRQLGSRLLLGQLLDRPLRETGIGGFHRRIGPPPLPRGPPHKYPPVSVTPAPRR